MYSEIDRMRNRIEGGMKEIREDVGHVSRGAAKILGLIESERIEEPGDCELRPRFLEGTPPS